MKVVLVEDHGLIAHTLSAALVARGTEVAHVDPAANEDIVAAVLHESADLALLDLDLGARGDATPLIEPLRSAGVRVLMVTGVNDPLRHAACVRAGAAGVVSKSASFDDLTSAVQRVLETGTLHDKSDRDELLAMLRRHEEAERERLAPFESLTEREAEVLGLLMRGRSVDQVAGERYVSIPTVRTQVRSILSKLQAPSQVVAIARAREARWVPPQEQ